jgi:cytochrome o ubiquinol oxidase subunit 2
MRINRKVAALVILGFGVLAIAAICSYLQSVNIPVLEPMGVVGQKERDLMYISLLLSAVVVVPVFIMLFAFSWKYRQGNNKPKKYQPNWDGSRLYESIWWAIPFAIIAVLGTITWFSSHDLDPFKPLSSQNQPIQVQVIALDWKWLFIYPKQNIATVNFVQFPVNTPVNFQITSDAPMNSFWIPQLGSQIYAMPGMSTKLHLMASESGNYLGKSANISGKGFSGMTFIAKASSNSEFNSWMQSVSQSKNKLTLNSYEQLVKPSQNNPVSYYSAADPALYDYVIDKYMAPGGHSEHAHGMAM